MPPTSKPSQPPLRFLKDARHQLPLEGDQLGEIDAKARGEFLQHRHSWIAHPSFNARHIGPVNVSAFRQLFLRDTPILPKAL